MESRCLCGTCDSYLLDFDDVLDAVEALQPQISGAFYPVSIGYSSWNGDWLPDLFGWHIDPEDVEPFEELFLARKDAEIEKAYGGSFSYVRWDSNDEGAPIAHIMPAPIHADSPMVGRIGRTATWIRLISSPNGDISEPVAISCNLVTGYGTVRQRKGDTSPHAFRISPGKLLPLITLQEPGVYRDRLDSKWVIYDGVTWGYVLGTESCVLLHGSRWDPVKRETEPIKRLISLIKKRAARADLNWGH